MPALSPLAVAALLAAAEVEVHDLVGAEVHADEIVLAAGVIVGLDAGGDLVLFGLAEGVGVDAAMIGQGGNGGRADLALIDKADEGLAERLAVVGIGANGGG